MASPLTRLLRRSFCASAFATDTANATSKTLVTNLFKERSLKNLVEKFKKSSEVSRFRCHHRIYEFTVRRLASAKRFSCIEEILEDQKKYKDISKEGFAIRLISLYGESGMFDHAFKTFDQMPELNCERTVKSFNALLAACVDSKKYDKVDNIFRELPAKLSIKPDVFSYNIVIKAMCEMGSLDSALLMLDEMEKNDLKPCLITFNTLLNAFYGDNQFSAGESIWARMEKNNIVPDIRTFNAKLRGLVHGRKVSEAVSLFEELRTKGLEPDVFSLNALIKGFCNDGNVAEAKRVYREVVEDGCVPNKETLETLLPVLCEEEDFDMALELCRMGLKRRRYLSSGLLQTVVNGLAKVSKVEEAKELVELGRSRGYGKSSLEMPSLEK